jgi:hypothetical protein
VVTVPLLLREVRGVEAIKSFSVNLLNPYDPDVSEAAQQQVVAEDADGKE